MIFEKKNLNFFDLAQLARKRKLDHFELIHNAYINKILTDSNKDILEKFVYYFKDKKNIHSQLYQDIFASFIVKNDFDKSFFEFGATDGMSLSNTYMLEENFGWNGILSEPSPQWYTTLKLLRPNTKIITKCIWSETGKKLKFFESSAGELSTVNSFIENEKVSMPGNVDLRKKNGQLIDVETVSLNDVIKNYFLGKVPSYISIDTEGSEYEILRTFDFKIYRPVIFTVEHNFTINQSKIDYLMQKNNYKRVFRELTSFDAWYVSSEVINSLAN